MKLVDVLVELGVTAVDMRQVRIGFGGDGRFRRPHRVRIDVVPGDFYFRVPVGGHAADCEHLVVGRAPVGRQQADHHHRIGEDVGGGVKGLVFGVRGAVLLGRSLQDGFQIDRQRMIAGGDHVLLMHVARGEAMKERQPGAGAAEKPLAAGLIGAFVFDEFGPAVAVARECAHGLELERRARAVQALDQIVPGDIEPQILRLVDDARAVLEADNADRTAVIMRIGEVAFDPGNAAFCAGSQDIAADRRQIGVEAQDEFARRIDPLARDCRHQPRKHRLVFEQSQHAAGSHVGDELIVVRCGRFARRGEALVNGRRGKFRQLPQQAVAQAGARGRGQVLGGARVDTLPQQRVGLLGHRQQELFERARLASR